MTRTTVTRRIAAPAERVFAAVSDLEKLPEVVPDIVRVETLSETRSGPGTRFRETRRMGKREASMELEVTECEPPRHLRIVADSHGTVWDSVFTVTEVEGGSELELVMDAKAHKLLPKLLNPIMKGLIRRGVVAQIESVKQYCEA